MVSACNFNIVNGLRSEYTTPRSSSFSDKCIKLFSKGFHRTTPHHSPKLFDNPLEMPAMQ